MPVYYPRLIATDSDYCTVLIGNCDDDQEPASEYAHSYPRQYLIPVTGEGKQPAYRMTIVINSVLGEYYGIQGVKWKKPPILNNPTETKTIHGRKLYLYADDGGHLTQVAWHQVPTPTGCPTRSRASSPTTSSSASPPRWSATAADGTGGRRRARLGGAPRRVLARSSGSVCVRDGQKGAQTGPRHPSPGAFWCATRQKAPRRGRPGGEGFD